MRPVVASHMHFKQSRFTNDVVTLNYVHCPTSAARDSRAGCYNRHEADDERSNVPRMRRREPGRRRELFELR